MQPVRAAVNTLLAAGDVVERKPTGKGRGRQLYVAHAAPAEGGMLTITDHPTITRPSPDRVGCRITRLPDPPS